MSNCNGKKCNEGSKWIAIDSAEDVDCDHEVLLWDGCDWHLDYVEYDADNGVRFFANGTEATHYMLLAAPLDNLEATK